MWNKKDGKIKINGKKNKIEQLSVEKELAIL